MLTKGWKIPFMGVVALVLSNCLQAQFAPQVGEPGTTAIKGDDPRFIEWATGCSLQRGLQNIADTAFGYASVGNENSALGLAGDSGVASLGDGGSATLTFDHAVKNGDGFDFAVFENGFSADGQGLAFLEYAFVEVSSDGVNFVRFPAVTNMQDTMQLAMQGTDCSLVNNLAGKYISGYGTPFDLDELKDSLGLDVNHITHIRIIDVVGSIMDKYATHDSRGKKVNDPWPTPFASCGFDLDAVGVLHAEGLNDVTSVATILSERTKIYPNPATVGGNVYVTTGNDPVEIRIADLNGRVVYNSKEEASFSIPTKGFSAGAYFVQVQNALSNYTIRLIVE